MVRKNGDAAVSGRIVEHTSWRNPGSVSSSVRVPPPIVGGRLVHADGPAGAGQREGRGEAVGARPDDDGVKVGRRHAAPDPSFGRKSSAREP